MPTLPNSLDYTDRDFDALRNRLINLIKSVFPTWTDHNVANFGNILLEMTAFTGDVLTFYQDGQASESRWSTALFRENLVSLAKLIGFKPEGAKAATVDLEFKVKDTASGGPIIGTFTLPIGTIVTTAEITDPITFQTTEVTSFLAAHDPDTAVSSQAENSQSFDEIFSNTGLANQEVSLNEVPYLDDSALATADDGTYTEVDNFLNSSSSDKHFTVTVNDDDRATLRFGNGVNGKVPSGNINVAYKTGGGSAGRVEADTITKLSGSFSDSLGNPVTVTVTNPLESSGEQERQNVEQIRAAAPESIRVIERAVSREDFEISARAVEGVNRALMTTSNEDGAVPENSGFLYLIPEGGGVPSTAIKDEVAARFAEDGATPSTLTFQVLIYDPIYKVVNIRAVVFFAKGADLDPDSNNYAGDSLRADIQNYFALNNADGSKNENMKFGFEYQNRLGVSDPKLPLSQIMDIFNDNANVRKLGDKISDFTLNGEHADVALTVREFPSLGTITIVDGDTLQTV